MSSQAGKIGHLLTQQQRYVHTWRDEPRERNRTVEFWPCNGAQTVNHRQSDYWIDSCLPIFVETFQMSKFARNRTDRFAKIGRNSVRRLTSSICLFEIVKQKFEGERWGISWFYLWLSSDLSGSFISWFNHCFYI